MTQTHTYVYLDIGRVAFNEIVDKLREAGYEHAFKYDRENRTIAVDMHGIAIRCLEPTEEAGERLVDIVFDGPPSHVAGRFVEVEDTQGRSVKVGEWIERENGMWALRLTIAREETP